MGTTLTGTTPQTTYDSLIKVTDNAPLTGSLKTLTDGLGNDSALALSTGAASVTGTLAVSSNLTVDTNTLFVDATNNRVGIGTTSNYSFNDDAKLVVANTSGNSTISIVSSTSGIGYLAFADGTSGTDRYTGSINYNHSTNAMTLHTNAGNERMIITSTGAVGIGTSSPASKFHIAGADAWLTLQRTSGTTNIIDFTDASSNRIGYVGAISSNITINAAAGNSIIFAPNNAEAARITSSGAVGIGTSSPVYKLQVSGASPAVSIDRTSGDQPKLAFNSVGTEYASIISNASSGENRFNIGPSGGWGGFHTFYTDTTEKVRIANNGNCGIGTTSPATKLDVNGEISTSGNILLSSAGGIYFDSGASKYLDDYEFGTFTPTIIGSTTAGTATYGGGQVGTYTKIGNVVYFQIYLGYSGGTGTGNLRISGLPFTIPTFDLPSFTFGVFLNVALTASNIPIAGGIGSTNQIFIDQIPTGGGSQTSVPYDDTAVIQLSGFYRV